LTGKYHQIPEKIVLLSGEYCHPSKKYEQSNNNNFKIIRHSACPAENKNLPLSQTSHFSVVVAQLTPFKGEIFSLRPSVSPPAFLCEINTITSVPEAGMGRWGDGGMGGDEETKGRRDEETKGRKEEGNDLAET
jgi:hypothetical protein